MQVVGSAWAQVAPSVGHPRVGVDCRWRCGTWCTTHVQSYTWDMVLTTASGSMFTRPLLQSARSCTSIGSQTSIRIVASGLESEPPAPVLMHRALILCIVAHCNINALVVVFAQYTDLHGGTRCVLGFQQHGIETRGWPLEVHVHHQAERGLG